MDRNVTLMRRFFVFLTLCVLCLVTGCGDGKGGQAGNDAVQKDGTDEEAADDSDKDGSLDKILDEHQLILGLDASFKPMGYTNENDEIVGFDIDVAEEVCSRLGVDLVKSPIEWGTKEKDLNSGKIDCIWNGMPVSDSNRKQMLLSEPYMKNSLVFVVTSASIIAEKKDLKGKHIAVQKGSAAQKVLKKSKIGKKAHIVSFAANTEALQQLDNNQVDAVFLDSVVIDHEMLSSGKEYVILPDVLREEEYAIGFRKEDQALCDKVEEILHEMKEDETLSEISMKWFGKDVITVK